MTGTGLDPWRILLAILVVATLLGLMPLALRRFRPFAKNESASQEPLEIVAQRALDMRHRVLVIRYRGAEHLLVLGGTVPVAIGGGDPAAAAWTGGTIGTGTEGPRP